MEMLESKLEALMLSKTFEELSPEERNYVLGQLTEAAYNDYHFILNSTVDALNINEKELVPNANIPVRLKEHFVAKFQPAKTPIFFNVFQPMTLYKSVAVLGITAIIIGFFIVNKPGKEINAQKPKHAFALVVPIEIKEKPGKVQQPVPAPVNVKLKKRVRVAAIKVEKDTLTIENSDLPGLRVYEPILCLEIDLDKQVPGLNN